MNACLTHTPPANCKWIISICQCVSSFPTPLSFINHCQHHHSPSARSTCAFFASAHLVHACIDSSLQHRTHKRAHSMWLTSIKWNVESQTIMCIALPFNEISGQEHSIPFIVAFNGLVFVFLFLSIIEFGVFVLFADSGPSQCVRSQTTISIQCILHASCTLGTINIIENVSFHLCNSVFPVPFRSPASFASASLSQNFLSCLRPSL